MSKILAIILKNFKILIRSKTSALIILFGPLVMILLVAAAFNTTSLQNIKVASYSSSYSDLTESILSQLADDQFTVIKVDSNDSCIEGIKTGNHHICAIFPPDMTVSKDNTIEFYADHSRVNLVWIVLNSISKKVETRSSELSKELTNTLLSTLKTTEVEMASQQDVLTKISSSASSINTDVDEIFSTVELLEIDFNASELNISEIKEETSRLEEKANITTPIRSLINDLEDKLEDLSKKIEATYGVKNNTETNLNEIKTSLTSTNTNLNSVKNSVTAISSSIQAIKIRDPELIVSPISSIVKPIATRATNLSYLLPTLVVLITMFISLLLASTIIIKEKTDTVYFRNFITPTSNITFIIAHYLTNMIIIILQLVIIFAVALYFFKTELLEIILNSSLALLLTATVFVSLGMLIGYLFNSEETSTLGAISIGSILLFFSNTILPLETLPAIIQKIADFNPFIIAESTLRRIILFESDIKTVYISLIMLLGYCILFFGLIGVAIKISKESKRLKRYLEKRKKLAK